MFYTQLLLSKKGALGIIWMAAHCHKRLKKDQVHHTHIPSSVDKILDDGVPLVTHRILAFLLLGVVRIYSKKVEYLLNDCHEILNRLCTFKTGKSAQAEAGVGISRPQGPSHSITLPARFELDTFDLGLDQDAMGGKVRSHEQEKHAHGRGKVSRRSGSFCKDIVPLSEAYSTTHTPPRDVFEAHQEQDLSVKSSSNVNISLAGVEVLRRACRSLEDCVDPIELDETENKQMHNKLSIKNCKNCPTNEAGSGSGSGAAVRLLNSRHLSLPSLGIELMVLDDAEKEQLNNRASHENVSPNTKGRSQEEQMHDYLSDKDLRTNIQWPTSSMESDFVVRLSNNGILPLPSLEMLRGTVFTLEDRLEPMVLDEAEEEQLYDRPSNKSTSSNFRAPIQDVELNSVVNPSHEGSITVENLEILDESNFSMEHLSSLMLLNLAEKKDDHDKPTLEGLVAEEKHMDHLPTQLSFQEHLDQVSSEAVYNAGKVGPELEIIPPESVKCQKPESVHVSILTPQPKLPDVGTVGVAAVQTPGRKESAKILKKRKALVDVATVVPNKVLKRWIQEDPIDLKRGRKNIPHTRLQAWRSHKSYTHSFLEPSIPGVSLNLCYNSCYSLETLSVKPSVGQDGLEAPTTHGAQERIPDIRSPINEESPTQTPVVSSSVADLLSGQTAVTPLVLEKPLEQTPPVRSPVAEDFQDQIPIAPGTPVAYFNSLRSHEAETVAADSDILESSSSLESIEKCTSSSEQLELDALFQEETRGDSLEKDAFSSRTRVIGSHLAKKLLHKRTRKEEEVLSLSRLLAGKTKKESTIMFYEILVLKTRDCIEVQQESAYHNILVRETPKLRQYFE
ncbi:sister chromatid cohesion 1 protein 2-like isoform X2 [Salvia splendens]|uniref:sister chromatid cohesion 1 protein 2-like isoform X2 n=1 Tax=Salvia splendens TaxID=180675 RepID=UPI001C279267|nr:sister chromatid cohesion 1 protein 2-like isoform X2 [Salvia splendens]